MQVESKAEEEEPGQLKDSELGLQISGTSLKQFKSEGVAFR